MAFRRGNIDHPSRIANAVRREERDRISCRTSDTRQHDIAFARAAFFGIGNLLLSLHPAIASDQHVAVFGNDKVLGRVLRFRVDGFDFGATFVLG